VVVFPNCKINLGLHIVRKRVDGFHDLETIFYPIPLCDALEIIEATGDETTIQSSGVTIDNNSGNNICVKAYNILKKDFHLPAVSICLHKIIPVGAGLGGGSSDGAFTLLLLNKKFNLGLSETVLLHYALQLGSDCPFFIKNAPCFATQRGEILTPVTLDLLAYKIVLINPGIQVNTGWAFSKITPQKNRASVSEIIQQPVNEWKNKLGNDFEEIIFNDYPSISEIKNMLYQNGAVYASMSGSGSSIYGIFEKTMTPEFAFKEDYFIRWLS
jgi:4-diphosphocytidyl-2-C-methyl-D-erythritol kinase